MDSKYNTNAALDNASGVATMLCAAKGIENNNYNIDIVPFNSEEYYEPQGELIYLKELEISKKEVSLLINIDTVAHIGSKVAVATFNFNEKEQQELDKTMNICAGIVNGQPWYAGEDIKIEDFAKLTKYSPVHVRRLFLEWTKLSPSNYIRRLKLTKSALMLRDESCRVSNQKAI